MNITIFLIKRCDIVPSVEQMLRTQLALYFDQVLARNPDWRAAYSVQIQTQRSCPAAAVDTDVVVYLVQNVEQSAFARFGVTHSSGHGGLTVSPIAGGLKASEVYVRSETGTLLAKTAFHEILHNKTGLGNRGLHGHHRGGISSATFRVDTPVTAEDLDLMGNHLGRRHPQWLGGCSP